MAGRVEGKVAIVTGGASGIGRATAIKFAKEGAKVAVVDVVVPGGEETAHMVQKAGGDVIFIKTDTSKREEVEAMVKKTVSKFGRLDCAFNNAGVGVGSGGAPAHLIDEGYFDRVLSINLKGTWYCMKFEIPEMLKNPPKLKLPQGEYGKGVIVNTSSMHGILGYPNGTAYQASKAAVLQISRVAAVDYCTKGIRVMALIPGPIKTGMSAAFIKSNPQGEAIVGSLASMLRMGEPEEVAGPVVFLCSDEASYMTGSFIAVDGGALIPTPPTPKTS